MVKLTDKSLDMGNLAKFNRRFRVPASVGVRPSALGYAPPEEVDPLSYARASNPSNNRPISRCVVYMETPVRSSPPRSASPRMSTARAA
jgi:hypothetical protein